LLCYPLDMGGLGAKLGVRVLGAFLVLVSGGLAAAPQCQSYVSKIRGGAVNYCVHRSRPDIAPLQNEPVVYFFHGIGGDAQSWSGNGYAEALDVLSPEEDFPPFTVVSFDTAKMSFFSDRGEVKNGPKAYETWFITEFMPYIEKTFGVCGTRKCRGTAGLSMGGYGALKTALKYKELFSFVGVNSGAIAPFNVWENLGNWNAYFNRHPIGPWQGQILLQEIRRIFTNRDMYERNDPTFLLSNLRDESEMPKMYLDVGGQDYFGFQEGFFRMTKLLDERRWNYVSYYEPNGGHDIYQDRRWWLMRFIRDRINESF
jgi:S-formylglutathione hydrolase FrmB